MAAVGSDRQDSRAASPRALPAGWRGGGAKDAHAHPRTGRAGAGTSHAGLAGTPEGHHVDQAVRGGPALSHYRQEPEGALRCLWRDRRGSSHHRQADQQKQRIWIRKFYILFFSNFSPLKKTHNLLIQIVK